MENLESLKAATKENSKHVEYEVVEHCLCGGNLEEGPIWGWGICTDCNTWVNNFRPKDSFINNLYGKTYWYDIQKNAFCPTIEERFHTDVSDRIPILLGIIRDLKLSEKRILEVGCGSGSLLYQLKQIGYNVLGTELSGDICEIVMKQTGISIIHGGIDDVSSGPYDLIVLIDIFEHLYDPVMFLHKCRLKLEGCGALLIHTPIITGKYDPLSYSVGLLWKDFHLYLYSLDLFREIINKSGFTRLIEHQKLFGWPIWEIRR